MNSEFQDPPCRARFARMEGAAEAAAFAECQQPAKRQHSTGSRPKAEQAIVKFDRSGQKNARTGEIQAYCSQSVAQEQMLLSTQAMLKGGELGKLTKFNRVGGRRCGLCHAFEHERMDIASPQRTGFGDSDLRILKCMKAPNTGRSACASLWLNFLCKRRRVPVPGIAAQPFPREQRAIGLLKRSISRRVPPFRRLFPAPTHGWRRADAGQLANSPVRGNCSKAGSSPHSLEHSCSRAVARWAANNGRSRQQAPQL